MRTKYMLEVGRVAAEMPSPFSWVSWVIGAYNNSFLAPFSTGLQGNL